MEESRGRPVASGKWQVAVCLFLAKAVDRGGQDSVNLFGQRDVLTDHFGRNPMTHATVASLGFTQ